MAGGDGPGGSDGPDRDPSPGTGGPGTGDGTDGGSEGDGGEGAPEGEDAADAGLTASTADLNMGREAVKSGAAKLTMAAFGFVGVVVFARVLGPVGVGAFYVAKTVALLLVRVNAGVGKAIKKRISEVDTDPRPYLGLGLTVHAVYTALVLLGCLGFLWVQPVLRPAVASAVAPVAGVLPGVEAGAVPRISETAVLGVFLVFFSVGLFQTVNRFHAGTGEPGESYWFDTARSVLTLAFQLALLFAGLEVFGLLIGLAGATLLTAAGVLLVDGRRGYLPRRPTRAVAEYTYEFARYSVVTQFVARFYRRGDVLILGAVAGPGTAGVYETALRLVQPADQVAASISNPLQVRASGRSSLGRSVREDVVNAVSYTGVLAVPLFFGALAMPEALMSTVFGAEFEDTGLALPAVALFMVVHVYKLQFEAVVDGVDRPDIVYGVMWRVLLAHVPLAVVLGLYYGVLGVVASTVAMELAMLVAYQRYARSLFDGYVLPRPVIPQVASGAVMFGVVALARGPVGVGTVPRVFGLVGLGGVVYFAALAALSRHFRSTALDVVGPVYRGMRSAL